jgi:hypothetical protein
VNIYRNCGQWCYSAWSGGDFDCGDSLDVDDESEAFAEVSAMFPAAKVARVADTNES